ncbi:serine/threonine-protein kinase [Zavarzinella formosa]|uniref:serine/threonine-protein kinase n=1 Tax=Zavarzinella formosa TaxID=360055 RepID=UPI0002DE69D8|nr:serine/threonine-protein kinase [Zavarzinella formosa]
MLIHTSFDPLETIRFPKGRGGGFMKFTYRWGQQPLAGFTIKRGLGQGGFGEVYFAVSDGGKEVALKLLLRGRTETELRGISNCLNLKHPNLVHLYDLRTDERDDHWLVMEYVQGEPLSSVLNRNPRGLPVEQARQWFLQIAKAVAYLHDHAVIHRDIKPGNVFVENGILKLGDYGLSKTVGSASLTQSANVGTVYYMAPEVAKGACTKQVDVYACGVMLYEMLTGELPFRGDSWAEVALRHQTDMPELNKLPPEYLAVVEKALCKKPELRHADMEEMIQAVEAIGRQSEPARPSEVVKMIASPAPAKPGKTAPPPLPKTPAPVFAIPGFRDRIAEVSTTLAFTPVASVVTVVAWTLCSVFFTGKGDWFNLMPLFCLTVLISWTVLIPAKLLERGRKGLGYWPMMVLGTAIGLAAFWLDGWTLPSIVPAGSVAPPAEESYFAGNIRAIPGTIEHLIGYMLLFGFGLGLTRWSDYANRRRKERFSLGPVFVAGFVSFMLYVGWSAFIHMDAPPLYMFLALAGSAGVVQMVSPWTPPPPPLPKRRRLQAA